MNLEASPTAAPSKKQMSEQDIGIQHAAINSLNAEFGQKNDSPELNWGIELKFEASPTAPSKKQMSEQDIGIQHAAINSLNAESGQNRRLN